LWHKDALGIQLNQLTKLTYFYAAMKSGYFIERRFFLISKGMVFGVIVNEIFTANPSLLGKY
jgi:hypothetical protein